MQYMDIPVTILCIVGRDTYLTTILSVPKVAGFLLSVTFVIGIQHFHGYRARFSFLTPNSKR